MSKFRDELKKEFQDKEYREAYAEDFLNTNIATQLVVLREQRGLTQEQLAQEIGTHQAGISRIENVNYLAWNIRTLKKIAFALGVRLKVSFETFGSLLNEAESFSRQTLERPTFEDDSVFHPNLAEGRPEEGITLLASLQPSAVAHGVAHESPLFTVVLASLAVRPIFAGTFKENLDLIRFAGQDITNQPDQYLSQKEKIPTISVNMALPSPPLDDINRRIKQSFA